jgi:purine nucleosidase
MPQKIILDTDIGDDIDDAYALSLVLASPELELVGVTTVFGNTVARARQAKTILKLAGREDVPVAAGCGAVLSPRITYRDPDLAWRNQSLAAGARDLLEDIRPRQDSTALPWEELTPLHSAHGVDFLIATLMDGAGDTIPVTIGAMTNLAVALVKEPRLLSKIPRILCMAAVFDRQMSEWNIACDPVAAAIVFNSRIPTTVIGLDVTLKCRLNAAQLDRLAASTRPVAQNLWAATQAWGHAFPVLHDPLAIEDLLCPALVQTRNGSVSVELSGDATYGYTMFSASQDDSGPHDVGVAVDGEAACELWLERVLGL